ncbi:MAG: UDP-N-acetylmuramoyl-tripeptide--D-alanyl-D-alanine ligase [Lachnospiraceae bacterium]
MVLNMDLTIYEVSECLQSQLIGMSEEHAKLKQLTGAVLDSRLVQKGHLFFATKGEKVDGHSFIEKAVKLGASLIVCEKVPEVAIPYVLVEDSFEALKRVATFYREKLTIPVVGITGSVGKTSTKEIIAAGLKKRYNVLKTEGNFNNEVGLPLTILRIREEHEIAVLEMGISEFGEMSRLTQIAKPDIAVITNIGQCHLENLEDRDGVARAKTEIFKGLSENGRVVLNGDDDKLAKILRVKGLTPVFFGTGTLEHVKLDVKLEAVYSNGIYGSDYTMYAFGQSYTGTMHLPGEHMVWNTMAAVCVGVLLDMSVNEVLGGVLKVESVGGRSNIIHNKDGIIIDDCYNANPGSMKTAIELLNSAIGVKTAILGDMFELGEFTLDLHAEVGVYAVTHGVHRMICIGELSKRMYEAAKLHIGNLSEREVLYFEDKASFFHAYTKGAFRSDAVLVKASHGMAFEEIVEWLKD